MADNMSRTVHHDCCKLPLSPLRRSYAYKLEEPCSETVHCARDFNGQSIWTSGNHCTKNAATDLPLQFTYEEETGPRQGKDVLLKLDKATWVDLPQSHVPNTAAIPWLQPMWPQKRHAQAESINLPRHTGINHNLPADDCARQPYSTFGLAQPAQTLPLQKSFYPDLKPQLAPLVEHNAHSPMVGMQRLPPFPVSITGNIFPNREPAVKPTQSNVEPFEVFDPSTFDFDTDIVPVNQQADGELIFLPQTIVQSKGARSKKNPPNSCISTDIASPKPITIKVIRKHLSGGPSTWTRTRIGDQVRTEQTGGGDTTQEVVDMQVYAKEDLEAYSLAMQTSLRDNSNSNKRKFVDEELGSTTTTTRRKGKVTKFDKDEPMLPPRKVVKRLPRDGKEVTCSSAQATGLRRSTRLAARRAAADAKALN